MLPCLRIPPPDTFKHGRLIWEKSTVAARMAGERFSLLSPGSLRSVFVLLVAMATAFTVVWMLSEQSQIRDCLEKKGRTTPSPVHYTTKPSWDYNWDMRAFRNAEETKAAGVRSILLVRHGQYHLDTGRLTDVGREQANLTGMRLKALNMAYRIIVHSTLTRAVETAEIIHRHLPHLPVTADDDLREGGPVQPQPTVLYWSLPDRDYFVDGPRLEGAFRKYFHRAETMEKGQSFEILIGHANIFRFFALRALQFPREAWMRVFIAHASITLLHINPDGTVTLSRFGDSGHFPPQLVTY